MPESSAPVVLTDVLDPLTGVRSDVKFLAEGPFTAPSTLDGSNLWSLPGLYDADAHLPVFVRGLRLLDRVRALSGGATRINTACPWHLVRELPLAQITAFFAATTFPRIMPILSVSDQPSSEGFAAWLGEHGAEVRETWMPTIKLYSNDPFFQQNLEAVWAAGCRAAIYFYDEKAFEDVVASRGGAVHFRHVTSKVMADQVASRPDSTSQTSPHFLLELPSGRPSALHVLPPVPGGAERESLIGILPEQVDLIASDHNAPILGNEGPGLEIEQHLLPALLTLVAQGTFDLATVVAKTTTGSAGVFRPAPGLGNERIIVDPRAREVISPWPGQESRRSAFEGLELSGSVVAVLDGERGFFL